MISPDTPIKAIPVTPTLEDEREAEKAARDAWELYLAACHVADEIKNRRFEALLQEIAG